MNGQWDTEEIKKEIRSFLEINERENNVKTCGIYNSIIRRKFVASIAYIEKERCFKLKI